ncbi:hypothetical protein E2320_014118 [Naja naja]|nr:hypothetical protein E2320_014118 [Naja naja]
MGASVVFGCSFVAFGPALALCLLTMAGDPLRVLTLVAGAFYWLVSLLLASLVWFISVHLSDQEDKWLQHLLLMSGAAVSALLQEAFRFAHFKLLKRADEGLVTISEDGPFPVSTKQMASVMPQKAALSFWELPFRSARAMSFLSSCQVVSGLFFGIISGLFSIINILADSIGPGTVGIHGDSPYYFITSAFLIMALVFLHTFRGTIFFSACEKRHYWKLALAIVSHLVISGLVSGSGRRSGFPGFELKCVFDLTFLNPCYEARLIPIFLITICRGVGAFFTAGGSLSNILACLSCREKEDGHVMVYSELQLPVGDRIPAHWVLEVRSFPGKMSPQGQFPHHRMWVFTWDKGSCADQMVGAPAWPWEGRRGSLAQKMAWNAGRLCALDCGWEQSPSSSSVYSPLLLFLPWKMNTQVLLES